MTGGVTRRGKPLSKAFTERHRSVISEVIIRRQKKKLTDDELMQRLSRGDESAFRTLYDRYKDQIFFFCFRILNDREAARDIMQEIFIRVYTERNSFETGKNFAGWIHTIARNLCLNLRRTQFRHTTFDETDETLSGARNLNDPPPDVGLREELANEIARLPEIYREAFILREYEDHSYQTIADITGVNLSTVRFRLFKARELLRKRLSERLDEAREHRNRS